MRSAGAALGGLAVEVLQRPGEDFGGQSAKVDAGGGLKLALGLREELAEDEEVDLAHQGQVDDVYLREANATADKRISDGLELGDVGSSSLLGQGEVKRSFLDGRMQVADCP